MWNFFEDIMMGLFAVAMLVWLIQIWKVDRYFSKTEKIRAVTFAIAFLLATFRFGAINNIIGFAISLIGFVISEFALAVVYYEKYKDLEIVNE